jgi:GNAT superfamily N-acetyltransferase
MDSIEIEEVRSKKDRSAFIKMPWRIYRNDPHWVPPIIADQKTFLDPEKGVFFDHGEAALFMAYRDGAPLGRISAHINYLYDERYDDKKGFFGFFECEDDQEVANALFNRAESYLRSKGRNTCEGSLSFGIYDEVGILVEGFDSDPYLLNVHNPPYYQRLIETAGYEKSIDWFAYRGFLKDYETIDERLLRIRDRTLKRAGLTIRQASVEDKEKEQRTIRRIFHSAWDKNWGHVPFSEREWRRLFNEILKVVVPELTLIAEKDGNPVAFTLTTYDANEAVKKINGRLFPFGFMRLLRNLKKTKNIRFILMGVLEQFRGRGIENALILLVSQKAYEMGFYEMEQSLVVENNDPMIDALRYFPVKLKKVYRLFKKQLS